jgi:TolB-like protein/Tfp pilus assembly protein PilF
VVREVGRAQREAPLGQTGGAGLAESRVVRLQPDRLKSLAVLPFMNESADANLEYLSDGITESIINSLSQLPQLRVMSRSSVFRYKGKELDAQQIGRELGVDAVLVGRVHSLDQRLVISTELVDVVNGWQLLGEKYDREAKDIIEIQVGIAKQISDRLQIKLTKDEERRLTERYTDNTEAYQTYLRGLYFWSKYTRAGLEKAIDFFRQAIDLDPTYALAYAGMANCYFRLATVYLPPKEALPKAKAAAIQALEIDPMLSEAHASLGLVKMRLEWDWEEAEREFRRAIELNPSNSTAHQWYSSYLCSLGRFDEAHAEILVAQELDPLSLQISVSVGVNFWLKRQYDTAVRQLLDTLAMDQNSVGAHVMLGLVYEQMGDFPKAIAELNEANRLGETSIILGFLGRVYAVSGKKQEAQDVLAALEAQAKDRYISAYSVALIHAGLGETDPAFIWLEMAHEQGDENLAWLAIDPRLDSLRTDLRFINLMERIGLKPSKVDLGEPSRSVGFEP